MKIGIKAIFTAFLALMAGNIVSAQEQRLILASASSNYPYERPVWDEEQAQNWFDAHSPIIGINCPAVPCDALTDDDMLRQAAAMGYNSVRWWPSSSTFISAVESYAAIADKYGMTCAPVFGFSHVPTSEADSASMEATVREIIRHFRNDKRIIMWDIWNEPEYTGSKVASQMQWVRRIAQWCREEGCTQAITCSILWDPEITNSAVNSYSSARQAAEKEMDLHNFHDYVMQEQRGTNINYVMERYKRVDNKPLICTECLTRTNGSGVAVSLAKFAQHKIGFYTWGLYSCDANWDVNWSTSTYYAFEPMFHNLLYAGGDPVDERELDYIKNFKFQEGSESIYPGLDITERWTKRRAWKWMNNHTWKGLFAASLSEAQTLVANYSHGDAYNVLAVRLSYNDYNSKGASTYRSSITSLATSAAAKGLRLLPILLTSDDMSKSETQLGGYVSNLQSNLYKNSNIAGWALFEQTSSTEPTDYKTKFATILEYARYTFPNQPTFMIPLVDATQKADSTAEDFANYLWQRSDIIAFNMANSAAVPESVLENYMSQYQRPIYFNNNPTLQSEFATYHVNWATSATLDDDKVEQFENSPLNLTAQGDSCRMPSWKAWSQVNFGPVKGVTYESLADALAGIPAYASTNTYNTVRVRMDYKTYNSSAETFKANMQTLLDSAQACGLKVLPCLIDDRYATRSNTVLCNYVKDIIQTFNDDPRIVAWELYNKPATASQAKNARMLTLMPLLFEAARSASPQRPVFVTPNVKTTAFASDYDYIEVLNHGGTRGGWNMLNHGNGSVNLTYLCWQLSDIVAYTSSQDAPQLGWLNSVAYRFGRPVMCTKWDADSSTTVDKTLDVFKDCHVMWFVNGTLDSETVKNFEYKTVITKHHHEGNK